MFLAFSAVVRPGVVLDPTFETREKPGLVWRLRRDAASLSELRHHKQALFLTPARERNLVGFPGLDLGEKRRSHPVRLTLLDLHAELAEQKSRL